MIIRIKCGEVYEYNKVEYVKILHSENIIEVKGNFEPRANYKVNKIRIETISNMELINDYLYKFSKTIKNYEGLCPLCNSDNIYELGFSRHMIPLNNNLRKKTVYEKYKTVKYKCKDCGEFFTELKNCDIEIFYFK